MGKKRQRAKTTPPKKTKDLLPMDDPLQDEADLAEIQKTMAEVKKLEALKAQKLIERGQLLEQLTGKTSALKQDTAHLTQTTHQLERFIEAKNRHLNSILIGMAGSALGAGYGFLMGYSWPLMMVSGILTGSLTYGLSTFASKIIEKVISIGDWFKTLSGMHLASSSVRTRQVVNKEQQQKIQGLSPRGIYSQFQYIKEQKQLAMQQQKRPTRKINLR